MKRPYLVMGVVHPTTGKPALVRFGESGYWSGAGREGLCEGLDIARAAEFLLGIQPAEVTEAALAGSMFGWELPAAKAARDLLAPRIRAWRAEKLLSFVERQIGREGGEVYIRAVTEADGSDAVVLTAAHSDDMRASTLDELLESLQEAP